MKTREDFNRPDVRIVVYAGTIQEGLAARLFPRAQVLKVDGDADQITPVVEGKAHAALLTTPTPNLVVRTAPDQLFLPTGSALQSTATPTPSTRTAPTGTVHVSTVCGRIAPALS